MKKNQYNEAVSPVVGVLLMLVVTIIIAAVVVAFTGGIGTAGKVPKAAISARYSQSGFMSISHDGGDNLPTRDTRMVIQLSSDFGDVDYQQWEVNKSIITNSPSATLGSSSSWLQSTGSTGIAAFMPGDTVYIPNAGLPYLQSPGGSSSATYRLNNTANLGKTFWLNVYDKSGKQISKGQVKIEP